MSNDIEKYLDFRKESLKITHTKNQIFDDQEHELGTDSGDQEITKLNGMTGFKFFMLGHVYMGVSVPYSLLESYVAVVEGDVELYTIQGDHFADGLTSIDGDWGDKVHAIQEDRFEEFTEFMRGQVFTRKAENAVYGVAYANVVIPDPCCRKDVAYNEAEDLVELRVFTPFSETHKLFVWVDKGVIHFRGGLTSPEESQPLKVVKEVWKNG